MSEFERPLSDVRVERSSVPTQESLGGTDNALQWIVDRLRSKMPADLKESERVRLLQEIWSGPDPQLDNQSPRALFENDPDRVIRFIDTLMISQ